MLQAVLLVAIAAAGTLGPAWDGALRTVTTVMGAALLVSGGVLAGRGLLDLRDNLTPLPHPRDGATLVERGAYGLVRHPIYGGLVLGAFGWGLLTASPAAVAGAAVLLGFFDLKSRREEIWLAARFGDYEAYRARTRRLIPYLY